MSVAKGSSKGAEMQTVELGVSGLRMADVVAVARHGAKVAISDQAMASITL